MPSCYTSHEPSASVRSPTPTSPRSTTCTRTCVASRAPSRPPTTTSAKLSERAGVGHAELSQIENGQRAASLITLDAIARGLQSSLTVLLDHEQPLDLLRDIEGALTLLRDAEPDKRDKAISVINAILIASAETPPEDK